MLGLGLGLTAVALRRPASLSSLFAGGQPGYWPGGYDPAAGRLWQDSAGATPVTAPGQPVGLVKRLAGTVDASQATALSRPTLGRWPRGGRRNLLTSSEDLGDTSWTKSNTLVVGQKTSADTGAGMTKVAWATAAGYQHSVNRASQPVTAVVGQPVTVVVDVEPAEFNAVVFSVGGAGYPLVDTVTGAVTGGAGHTTTQMIGGTCRITIRTTATGTSLNLVIWPGSTGLTAGDGVSGMWIGRAQMDFGSDVTAYQRVGSANDITEAGRRDLWHLSNDGGDSPPVTLPAGTYGRAAIDHLGAVAVDTVTLAAAGSVETLVHQRQADVVIRQGAFSPAEIAHIESYARRIAA